MHQAGDVKKHLTDPTNQNSLFQVASQFNLLEMASPAMTPERGVDIYYNDPTQGQGSSDGPAKDVRIQIQGVFNYKGKGKIYRFEMFYN